MSLLNVRRLRYLLDTPTCDILWPHFQKSDQPKLLFSSLLEKSPPRTTGEPSLLIISPTRDSASNIVTQLNIIRARNASVVALLGGTDKQENARSLLRGCDYVVGTPGRVNSMFQENHLACHNLKTVVLDEADVLLSSSVVIDFMRSAISLKTQRIMLCSNSMDKWFNDVLTEAVLRPDCKLEEISGLSHESGSSIIRNLQTLHCYAKVSFQDEAIQIQNMVEDHFTKSPGKCVILVRSSADLHVSHSSMAFRNYIYLTSEMSDEVKKDQLAKFRSRGINAVLAASDLSFYELLGKEDLNSISLLVSCGCPKKMDIYARNFQLFPKLVQSVVFLRNKEMEDFKRVMIGKGIVFSTVPLPSPDALSVKFMMNVFRSVESISTTITPPNQLVHDCADYIKLHGVELVLGLLTMIEARPAVLEKCSPLSGLPEYSSVLLYDPFMKKLKTHENCHKLIKNCLRKSDENKATIGRIALSEKGFVVDVPTQRLAEVMSNKRLLRSFKPIVVKELPRLVDNSKLFILRQASRDRKLLLSKTKRQLGIRNKK